MSRFISEETARLEPYTPGEQPAELSYIKLNTNESPFPPSPKVLQALSRAELLKLNLYSDPACARLTESIARQYELKPTQVLAGNGSDEILSFAFRAFCGNGRGAAFPDVTYGFYKVWAAFYGISAAIVPLREDFTVNVEDYFQRSETVFLANPNALTGIALPISEIQRLLESNTERLVVVDEAYVDFGGESCVPLLYRYDNLLVVQTFSKSRNLAGGRLGFALGSPALIDDLNRVKYSFNPYNVNRLSIAAGAAAMEDTAYFKMCVETIQTTREWTASALTALGFMVLPSKANFLFVSSDAFPDGALYRALKENGILVRWFAAPRIQDFYRITIGSMEQMCALVEEIQKLLEEV